MTNCAFFCFKRGLECAVGGCKNFAPAPLFKVFATTIAKVHIRKNYGKVIPFWICGEKGETLSKREECNFIYVLCWVRSNHSILCEGSSKGQRHPLKQLVKELLRSSSSSPFGCPNRGRLCPKTLKRDCNNQIPKNAYNICHLYWEGDNDFRVWRYLWRLTMPLEDDDVFGGRQYLWRMTMPLEGDDAFGGWQWIGRVTIEIVLKDSTAFVYVTKSEKSSHFTLMTWFFTLCYINKGCGIF